MKCLVEFKHYPEGLSPYVSKKTWFLNVSASFLINWVGVDDSR